jgi:MqsR (Motility quorum-sensing regulator) toxin of toxin-antitoxin system
MFALSYCGSLTLDEIVAPCYLTFCVAKATYSLALIKGLMRDGDWYLTESARDTVTELGFDDEDVYDCIVNRLEETHLYKTMAAATKVGLMQDVYHITYEDVRLYVKLQVNVQAVVISFKQRN